MKPQAKRKLYKKIALALSLCAILVWAILGTGASLAWFSDTSTKVNNIFHFADFELEVSHRLTDGTWEKVDSQTAVFDEKALYEPGYVQVVYLKVENKGSVPFEFKTAVTVTDLGQPFKLQDYLRFGLVTADTEEDMKNSVPNRDKAKEIATSELDDYETETAELKAGETSYIALIVRMPEEVDNVANYRGETAPQVELGLVFTAEQVTD